MNTKQNTNTNTQQNTNTTNISKNYFNNLPCELKQIIFEYDKTYSDYFSHHVLPEIQNIKIYNQLSNCGKIKKI